MTITEQTVVLITGASAGIGKALALALGRRGARLVLLARREELLKEVADEARSLGAPEVMICSCDVGDRSAFRDAISEALARFNHIDVLVNNAGSGHFAYIEDTPEDHIEKVFRVNVYALWHGTGALIPHMRERGSGHIINIASLAGRFPFPADAAYVAAKHATVGFTRALRSELYGSGIDVSVVLPAGVMTDWASTTEGGSILSLFEYESGRGAEIAKERGIETPVMPTLMSAEDVAAKIADLIEQPQPELYTHEGSEELVRRHREDQATMEECLAPFWLANREGYERMRRSEGGNLDSSDGAATDG